MTLSFRAPEPATQLLGAPEEAQEGAAEAQGGVLKAQGGDVGGTGQGSLNPSANLHAATDNLANVFNPALRVPWNVMIY